MKVRRPRSMMQWARRLSQALFLGLFFWLFLAAHLTRSNTAPEWLKVFFHFDPLVAVGAWLSAHSFVDGSVQALIVIAITLVLGRVFCGWFCPMGAMQHLLTWIAAKTSGIRRQAEDRSPWQRAKYLLLIALLVAALMGVHWTGILDPMPFLYRATTTFLTPAFQYGSEKLVTFVYDTDPGIGPARLTLITEPVYAFLREDVFEADRQTFHASTLIALAFILVTVLNFWKPRFWCRYICPLGAMLGLFSKRPALQLQNNVAACTGCGRCSQVCPAAAQPHRPGAWLPSECYLCWNCVPACNRDALGFAFTSPLTRPEVGGLDLSKRGMLAAGVGGLAGFFMLRLTPLSQGTRFDPGLIRPPGALREEDFLSRCLQCGLCMRACPTTAIHPAGFEHGLEPLWTPVMKVRYGYCDYDCSICGQVCPTQAIQKLTIEKKREVKIGLATFDTARCLPYAYTRECMVCEEHCPLPKKAIHFVLTEVQTRDGGKLTLKQPRVDPDLCTGCGQCEWSCVFRDLPAIRVTSANETRHSQNRAIMPYIDSGAQAAPAAPASTTADPYGQ